MEHDFWHQRWQQNQIGFHNAEINPHLQRHWTALDTKPDGRVFVPLCGKSNDLLWLRAQGHQVVGIELSPLAVEAFFADNGLQPTQRRNGDFVVSEVDGLEIFCGDFFALTPELLGPIDAVYDRAALVALPPETRLDYAARMAELMEPGVAMLLVAFDYPQHEMSGPPFSVVEREVDLLYHSWCTIDLLAGEDVLERELHFRERGLSRLSEQVYRLRVR